MTITDDHLTSLDSTLALARNAWAEERKFLLDRIFALETELCLYKDHFNQASAQRNQAERVTAKLLAQFGMVSIIFEEAKQLALATGFLPEATKTPTPISTAASLPPVTLSVSDDPPHL